MQCQVQVARPRERVQARYLVLRQEVLESQRGPAREEAHALQLASDSAPHLVHDGIRHNLLIHQLYVVLSRNLVHELHPDHEGLVLHQFGHLQQVIVVALARHVQDPLRAAERWGTSSSNKQDDISSTNSQNNDFDVMTNNQH